MKPVKTGGCGPNEVCENNVCVCKPPYEWDDNRDCVRKYAANILGAFISFAVDVIFSNPIKTEILIGNTYEAIIFIQTDSLF